jgi:hypothetical protein
VIGGVAFGLWVWQDPTALKYQLIDNVMMGGRTSGLSSPLSGIIREFTERYPHAFGLEAHSSGHSGPIFLKSLILVGYAAGILGRVLIPELRRNRNYRILLLITLVYFIGLSLLDGQKETPYLIQIIPLYVIFLAIVLEWFWRQLQVPRFVLIGAVLSLIALPAGGMALRTLQNTYGRFYSPTVAFLQ